MEAFKNPVNNIKEWDKGYLYVENEWCTETHAAGKKLYIALVGSFIHQNLSYRPSQSPLYWVEHVEPKPESQEEMFRRVLNEELDKRGIK